MEQINVQVAQRLRELRRAQGLSLEEVAQRSGVSRAMLSQIETLKANPTIAVLWKVAAGLGVSFAALVELDSGPEVRVSRAREARFLYSEDGRFSSRPLLSNVPGHRVELYQLRLEVGAEELAEPHPTGSFEQLVVTRGRLRVTLAATGVIPAGESPQESHELGAGDALFFPADRPHRYEALGQQRFVGLSLILYGS